MLKSISNKLNKISIPRFDGEIKMLPFELSSLIDVPLQFLDCVENMICNLPKLYGVAYLTVDGRTITQGETHRRGGAHIDGNYIDYLCSWGNGGGNGWKVMEGGVILTSKEHEMSYENENGGMLMASDFVSCKGWNGEYDNKSGVGGDCSHIELKNGFNLDKNTVYYGSSQFIHESLPIKQDTHRTLIRITLPIDYPIMQPIIN